MQLYLKVKNIILNTFLEKKHALIIYSKFIAIILIIDIVHIIVKEIIPNFTHYLFLYNPILNGFIHSGFDHFFDNVILIFLLLLPKINHQLGIKGIILFTVIISTISFPFVLLGISDPIRGSSGLYFSLLTRYLISRENHKIIYICILSLFVFKEIYYMGNQDNISHFIHLIGVAVGLLSMKFNLLSFRRISSRNKKNIA
jgi:hypothetical protein